MAIPIATTHISVLRRPEGAGADETGYVDPFTEHDQDDPDDSQYVAVATGVRATIASPAGSRSFGPGGGNVVETVVLQADPCDLQEGDVILDESTDIRYAMTSWFNYEPGRHFIPSSQASLTRTTRAD